MMKLGIIFDMDGTLWDSSYDVAKSWTERARQLGFDIEITRDAMTKVMGKPMNELADILFAELPKEVRPMLLEECGNYENDYLRRNGAVIYPELENTLKKLAEKYSLYIVSNCQSGYIEAFLDHYGFGKYFADIECYGNNLKQKYDNITLIAERNSLDKAYYVGDIQADYEASKKAGCGFIHAAYGFGTISDDVPKIGAFSELPELLEAL